MNASDRTKQDDITHKADEVGEAWTTASEVTIRLLAGSLVASTFRGNMTIAIDLRPVKIVDSGNKVRLWL